MGRSYRRRNGRPIRENRPFRERGQTRYDKAERAQLTGWQRRTPWVHQDERQVAPCGKLAHDRREAEARAALSLGGRRPREPVELEAYRCRDERCAAEGFWHVRSVAKRKRKPPARQRRYKKRRALREELPLRVWDDEGGGSAATWLATGQTDKLEGLGS